MSATRAEGVAISFGRLPSSNGHHSGVEEWMAFFEDPDGQLLALMSQVKP